MNQNLTYQDVVQGPDRVCLAPGTPVATPAGTVAIEALRAGDDVLTSDPATGSIRAETVTRTLSNHTDWFVELTVGHAALLVTRSHRVRTSDPDGWLPARLVTPGTGVVTATGRRRVTRVRLVQRMSPTHNLEVSGAHSFFAGPAGVLVHNADDVEPPRDFASLNLWPGEIYYISIRRNNVWEVIYVGSTNKKGLSFKRFWDGHLLQGRPGARNFKPNKAEWLHLVEAAGNDTAQGMGWWRWGDIKLEIKEHDEFTDLALNLLEEAHIRLFDPSQLQNEIVALSEDAFKKYYHPKHAPCR